jgi:invasion protein IalB
MLERSLRAVAMLGACAVLSMGGPVWGKDTALPGGASSLQETYQDWQIACRIVDKTKSCSMSQQQVGKKNQRVLAVELQAGSDGAVTGVLVLPFGLLLDKGVTLQIDDKPALAPLRFRTCMPVGCLVPLSFDSDRVSSLGKGTALKLKATASDADQEVVLTVSLKGFAAALDRMKALAGS